MARLSLRALALATGILIIAGGCASDVSVPATGDLDAQYTLLSRTEPLSGARLDLQALPPETVSQEIGPEGGVLRTASGHTLAFPAGAVSQPTRITLTEDAAHVGVQLEPHGLQFPAGRGPVLTLSHAGTDVAPFSRLTVVYTNELGSILEVLPSRTERNSQTVTTRLQHFSGYILAGS